MLSAARVMSRPIPFTVSQAVKEVMSNIGRIRRIFFSIVHHFVNGAKKTSQPRDGILVAVRITLITAYGDRNAPYSSCLPNDDRCIVACRLPDLTGVLPVPVFPPVRLNARRSGRRALRPQTRAVFRRVANGQHRGFSRISHLGTVA